MLIRGRVEDGLDLFGEFVWRDLWVRDLEGLRGKLADGVSDFGGKLWAKGELDCADDGDSGGWVGWHIRVGDTGAVSVGFVEGSGAGLSEVVDVHDGVSILWAAVCNTV